MIVTPSTFAPLRVLCYDVILTGTEIQSRVWSGSCQGIFVFRPSFVYSDRVQISDFRGINISCITPPHRKKPQKRHTDHVSESFVARFVITYLGILAVIYYCNVSKYNYIPFASSSSTITKIILLVWYKTRPGAHTCVLNLMNSILKNFYRNWSAYKLLLLPIEKGRKQG